MKAATAIVAAIAILVVAWVSAPVLAQEAAAPAPAQETAPSRFSMGIGWIHEGLDAKAVKALREMAGPKFVVQSEVQPSGRNLKFIRLIGSGEEPAELAGQMREKLAALQREAFPMQYALEETIDINFGGGTVEDFLAALFPKPLQLNIVYATEDLRTYRVPAVSLKAVQRESVLKLVPTLGQGAGAINSQMPGRSVGAYSAEFLSDRDVFTVGQIPTLVVRWNAVRPSGGKDDPKEPIVLRVNPADASGAEARAAQEEDQQRVLSAIQDGIEVRGGATPEFKIKLNRATGILFVQGSSAEKALVTSIIKAMTGEQPAQSK